MCLKRYFEGRKTANELKTEKYKKALTSLRPKDFKRDSDEYHNLTTDEKYFKTVAKSSSHIEFCDTDMLAQIDKFHRYFIWYANVITNITVLDLSYRKIWHTIETSR